MSPCKKQRYLLLPPNLSHPFNWILVDLPIHISKHPPCMLQIFNAIHMQASEHHIPHIQCSYSWEHCTPYPMLSISSYPYPVARELCTSLRCFFSSRSFSSRFSSSRSSRSSSTTSERKGCKAINGHFVPQTIYYVSWLPHITLLFFSLFTSLFLPLLVLLHKVLQNMDQQSIPPIAIQHQHLVQHYPHHSHCTVLVQHCAMKLCNGCASSMRVENSRQTPALNNLRLLPFVSSVDVSCPFFLFLLSLTNACNKYKIWRRNHPTPIDCRYPHPNHLHTIGYTNTSQHCLPPHCSLKAIIIWSGSNITHLASDRWQAERDFRIIDHVVISIFVARLAIWQVAEPNTSTYISNIYRWPTCNSASSIPTGSACTVVRRMDPCDSAFRLNLTLNYTQPPSQSCHTQSYPCHTQSCPLVSCVPCHVSMPCHVTSITCLFHNVFPNWTQLHWKVSKNWGFDSILLHLPPHTHITFFLLGRMNVPVMSTPCGMRLYTAFIPSGISLPVPCSMSLSPSMLSYFR